MSTIFYNTIFENTVRIYIPMEEEEDLEGLR